jgi:hypothetical protein
VAFSNGAGGFNVTNNAIASFASWAADRNSKKLVGNFSGDGKADVALIGPSYWRTIPTATSAGNGSFSVTNPWVGDFAIWAADPEAQHLVGDFNADGYDDIALSGSPYWNTLPVAFSNGNGTYTITNFYIGDFASWSSHIEVKRLVGDFDGDGDDDIALTGPSEWGSVPVARSNRNGTFTVANYYIGEFASWSAHPEATHLVGDFDGNYRDDIALTGVPGWTSVPVAFGDGAGGFIVANQYQPYFASAASGLAKEKVTGDFNGDGRTDIAVRPSQSYMWIAYSNGDGTFNYATPTIDGGVWGTTFARDVFTASQAVLLVGDFSGDDRTELALTGPDVWRTMPVTTPGTGSFTITNPSVGDFGGWGSEPILW